MGEEWIIVFDTFFSIIYIYCSVIQVVHVINYSCNSIVCKYGWASDLFHSITWNKTKVHFVSVFQFLKHRTYFLL